MPEQYEKFWRYIRFSFDTEMRKRVLGVRNIPNNQ